MKIPHIPVLLEEVSEFFSSLDEGIFLDCTLGYGGHSERILKVHPRIELVACDQDNMALEFSKKRLKDYKARTSFYQCNFCEILKYIDVKNLKAVLIDLGVSSLQLDENERGFALNSDFLDMRMNKEQDLSAFEVVNFYNEEKLSFIFQEYGELSDAKKIAQKICLARIKKQIQSAKELCSIIGNEKLKGRKVFKAKLVFQALRIEVNQELKVLEQFLKNLELLKPKNCIVAVISFHSLEDRIVKNFFKKWSKDCICDEKAMRCECGANHSLGKILSKKAIVASEEEKKMNSRSSCAKMRVFYFKD